MFPYALAGAAPTLDSPTSGEVLSGVSQTFSWSDNGAEVLGWWLYVGTTAGGSQIHNSHLLGPAVNTVVIDGLPTDGSEIFARLWYRTSTNTSWAHSDSQFTTQTQAQPALLSPATGSQLTGAIQHFQWANNQLAVNGWWLYVGSSQGGRQFYNSGFLGAAVTTTSTSSIPLDGAVVHARLWYRLPQSSAWLSRDYTFTAELVNEPVLTAPVDGGALGNTSQLYSWNAQGHSGA